VDEECQKASDAVQRHGVTWPVTCDGLGLEGDLARAYNVQGTPSYFVIAPDGRLHAKHLRSGRRQLLLCSGDN
jgi:hypothetical protein